MCHNQGVNQLRQLRKEHPQLWALLLKWDTDSPVNFKANGHTVHDYDRRFQLEDEHFLVPGDPRFKWSMLDGDLQYRLFLEDGAMRPISEIKANYRLRVVSSGEDGFAAYINHPCYKPTAIAVIASWGGGWEHVSVSLARRCPTWEEMCMVKDIFWGEEECVVQFHPPRSEYVNRHPYCLHLWKKIGEEYETPPKEYVG